MTLGIMKQNVCFSNSYIVIFTSTSNLTASLPTLKYCKNIHIIIRHNQPHKVAEK